MAMPDSRQMNRMRQEAIRRSQEMHRRSVVNSAHYSQRSNIDEPPAQISPESDVSDTGKTTNPTNQLNGLLDGIFGGNIDSDKLLIAAILLLLIKEGADKKLILALGYILF